MVHLLDLPDELLLLIVENLLDEWLRDPYKDLRNLAAVCKQLTPLACRMRIRHFNLYQRPEYKGGEVEMTAKDNLHLLNFFEDHPESVNHVQKVSISWGDHCHTESFKRFLHSISSSTSILKLRIVAATQTNIETLESLVQPILGSLPALRDIHFDHYLDVVHPEHLLVLLNAFPGIERLQVRMSKVVRALAQPHPRSSNTTTYHGPFKLKSLTANGVSGISHTDMLRLIMPRARSLERLDIGIPGPGVRTLHTRSLPISGERFSPRTIGQLLLPASNSLKTVRIGALITSPKASKYVYVRAEEHDKSRIDLHQFVQLSRLELSSYLLFGTHCTAKEANGANIPENGILDIWKYLPPNIESLTIAFEGQQGIFNNEDDSRDIWNPIVSDGLVVATGFSSLWMKRVCSQIRERQPLALQWLFEIVQQKAAGQLQSLTSIHIQECYSSSPGYEFLSIGELYPDLVNSDIDITIRLMVPGNVHHDCEKAVRGFTFLPINSLDLVYCPQDSDTT